MVLNKNLGCTKKSIMENTEIWSQAGLFPSEEQSQDVIYILEKQLLFGLW